MRPITVVFAIGFGLNLAAMVGAYFRRDLVSAGFFAVDAVAAGIMTLVSYRILRYRPAFDIVGRDR